MGQELIEIVILEVDYHIIEKVRELRIRHTPYFSQLILAQEMELPESYVSKVENMKLRYKYNMRALNKIANIFQLSSYCELFPTSIFTTDLVKMRLEKMSIKNGKLKVNEDGTVDKAYKVISIKPLTEKETLLWQANKLPYLTIIKQGSE